MRAAPRLAKPGTAWRCVRGPARIYHVDALNPWFSTKAARPLGRWKKGSGYSWGSRTNDPEHMNYKLPSTEVSASPAARHAGLKTLSGVRAVVMLAGSVRANQLRKATGRSPLEMPVSSNRTVLDEWREQLTAVAEQAGLRELPVRIMVDQSSPLERTSRPSDGPVRLQVERDPSAYRGTGGLLSDLSREYPDDARLMVVHASQLEECA